ncbi:MAG: hypothetical protein GW795_15770 [Cyanobacteria bacterium]|nr:hypothetical protein [Cyanobacteria bacterium CG_2015-16_32_12]NCO79647.1 hypothetical protein [Cyanobacteria bacterium CG_2015-22_32_23]NCQ05830.1 hypothetical protein [Cyanobacteria bacterium CG_2015-09_32_10]NCQ43283.1 hypothetical protein [Cyanobacteria bacterium CG_2015-04_32_10]
MRNIVFDPKAFKQFNEWAIENKKLYQKIVELINDITRHPFPVFLAQFRLTFSQFFLQFRLTFLGFDSYFE